MKCWCARFATASLQQCEKRCADRRASQNLRTRLPNLGVRQRSHNWPDLGRLTRCCYSTAAVCKLTPSDAANRFANNRNWKAKGLQTKNARAGNDDAHDRRSNRSDSPTTPGSRKAFHFQACQLTLIAHECRTRGQALCTFCRPMKDSISRALAPSAATMLRRP